MVFNCSICAKIFTAKSSLKTHVKMVHDKITNYRCMRCDYITSTKGNLSKHIKQVHDRIQDIKCDTCVYTCSSVDTLSTHKLTCTGKDKCSAGEFKIKFHLNLMLIKYIHDRAFEALTLECKQNLRFDFYVPEFKCVIEFDGQQHFRPVNFGGMPDEKAQRAHERTVQHDNIKNEFCARNGYDMLRIKYNDYLNIERILYDYFMTKGWNADAH